MKGQRLIRPHERDYRDIRAHLMRDHGMNALGAVKLSTYIRHRSAHEQGAGHSHRTRRACEMMPEGAKCPCHATHKEPT